MLHAIVPIVPVARRNLLFGLIQKMNHARCCCSITANRIHPERRNVWISERSLSLMVRYSTGLLKVAHHRAKKRSCIQDRIIDTSSSGSHRSTAVLNGATRLLLQHYRVVESSLVCKTMLIRSHSCCFSTQAQAGNKIGVNSSDNAETPVDDEDIYDDDNDSEGTSRSSNPNSSYDDVFNIEFDENSLELPPNPEIPLPKVRTPYPIAPPQPQISFYEQQRNNRLKKNETSSSLSNERLVSQIVNNMKRRNKNAKGGERQNGYSSNGSDYITGDSIQVRVVPDPLLAKAKEKVDATRRQQKESSTINGATKDIADTDDVDESDDPTTVSQPKQGSQNSNNKPKAMVMSLSEAIKMSVDQMKDLVEVAIDQDVPVVTISNVKAIAYQTAKSKKSMQSNSTATQTKEVTMQAAIATNDLQRKINEIFKFLDKGHTCIVSIRVGRKQARDNEFAASDALKRIVPLLDDKVEMVVPPEINPLRTMASFRVRAKKN